MWWVLFLFFMDAHAETCIPGTVKDSQGTCTQCLSGYAQSEPDQSICLPCRSGTFSPDKGYSVCSICPTGFFSKEDTVNTQCISCSPGKFQDVSGTDYCLECDLGLFSDAAASYCTGCSTGRYSDEYGASTCQDCHRGRSGEDVGSTECETCPNGQYTITTGQATCKNCSLSQNCRYCAGFGGEPGNCTACEEGKYSSTIMETCERCDWGTVPSDESEEVEDRHDAQPNGVWQCSRCEDGYYYEPITPSCIECGLGTTTVNFSCVNCIPGQFRDQPVSDLDDDDEETNTTNTTNATIVNLCSVCPAGFYGEDPIRCTACAAGRYQLNTNQTTCGPCDDNLRSMSGASTCTTSACLAGEVDGICEDCPAGWQPDGATPGSCQACGPNTFKPYTYGVCQACPDGKISNSAKTGCDFCGTGQYEVSGACTVCLVGTYMPTDSPTPPVSCYSCIGGQYQDQTGQTTCKDCPAGFYQDESGPITCKDCPVGWVANYSSSEGCEICTGNTGQDDVRQRTCDICDNDNTVSRDGTCQYCLAGTEIYGTGTLRNCRDCQEGRFSTAGLACIDCPIGRARQGDDIGCQVCPTGFLSNVAGPGSFFCINCDSDEATEKTSCQDCPAGNFFNGTACETCPGGWIAANTGAISCSICGIGSVETDDNKKCTVCQEGKGTSSTPTLCQNCVVGKYSKNGVCYLCKKGTYQNIPGQSSCIDCPTATITIGLGADDVAQCLTCPSGHMVVNDICAQCPAHTYITGNSCEKCIAGKFSDNIGSTDINVCDDCPVGKASVAGEGCKNCASGKYTDQTGQGLCVECVSSSGSGCAECIAGKYGTPASGCRNCPSGYRAVGGQSACAPCNIGSAQPKSGSSLCLECLPGKYSNQVATKECLDCALGKFLETSNGGQCYKCPIGSYSSQLGQSKCHRCPGGTYTVSTGSVSVGLCLDCPAGYMETKGICSKCPERFYQPARRSTACISCPSDEILSARGSTSIDDCFSKEGLVSYVFGMKGDSKEPQSYSKTCEIRPNLVMLCPGCSCDDDSRNGFWSGPKCDECRRGFATSSCTAKCPAYDGEHDSTMCSGNGFCWFGKFGTGLCYCGGKSKIDPSGENVVVDVQLCPKGTICPGYGITKQTETTYKPLYYIIRYRQFSTFVLLLSRYTPKRGHMWFKRFPPSIAHENTCLSCVGTYSRNPKTTVGFWNKRDDYEDFSNELQSENGFHGENCQYECGLCLNGGRCLNAPHPYRYSYTIEDSFRGEKPIFLPSTTCICSSLVYDPENMCCPNGFQPYVHYGLRLNQNPFTRFNRVPYLSGIKNEIRDYWINRDIWLDIAEYPEYRTPFLEPDSGKMWVANNNNIWSDVQNDYVQVDYRESGPYNKHIFYGVPREICRACPGLFGKGVNPSEASGGNIDTEFQAEKYWWDNAMGASARKCNGIGVCDFYARPTELVVDFMGDATEYPMYERGRLCKTTTIGPFQGNPTVPMSKSQCIKQGLYAMAAFIAFSEPYSGGKMEDMLHLDGKLAKYPSERSARQKHTALVTIGYASFLNGTELIWTVIESKTNMPIPDSDSQFTSYSSSADQCGVFATCENFITMPRFNIYKLQYGRGDDRPEEATFNRFDTCFTYTKDSDIQTLGFYVTQTYENGEDPFLGGLCPKGHYCTEHNNIGYKEACPHGYYQPKQGQTRTISETRCNIATRPMVGCQSNEGTVIITDYTDDICIRCPRNFYAAEGSSECTECPYGSVKKISGTPVNTRGTAWTFEDLMLNFPTSFTAGYNPWYYISNELGREETDCAQVPPGIVHLPTINGYMEYEKPNFLAVIACPFGFSSRPGTFVFEGFTSLTRLVATSPDAVIDPPFIEFKRTYIDKNIGSSDNCNSKNIKNAELDPPGPAVTVLDIGQCEKLLIKDGITEMRYHNGGIKGCYIDLMRPDIGIFNSGGVEIDPGCLEGFVDGKYVPVTFREYLCRVGDNNDGLAGKFARANCFRCPGNSITGPSSTACTTCFANQMKSFAKEAIQKVVEGATHNMYSYKTPGKTITDFPQSLVNDVTVALENIEFLIGIGIIYYGPETGGGERMKKKYTAYNSDLKNYDLTLDVDQQKWPISYEFKTVPVFSMSGQSEAIELKLSDCFLICSHVDRKIAGYPGITAVGLYKDKTKPQCACSNGNNDAASDDGGYAWLRVDGGEQGKKYEYIFDGECSGTSEEIIYTRTTINPGLTNFQRKEACFERCVASKGFVIIPDTGECKCENVDSGCVRISNTYIRYDIKDEMKFASWGLSALPLCAACQPGKRTQGGCISCSYGQFTETPQDAQAISCKSCQVGTYADAISSTGCKDCALGKYTDATVETKQFCKDCPTGWKQGVLGQDRCIVCSVGYFAPSLGSYICTICPIGYYQDEEEMSNCKNCASFDINNGGYYNDKEGKTTCIECPAGYMKGSTTECTGCTAGKYQSAVAAKICISCVEGQYASDNKRTTNCHGCARGRYAGTVGSKSCKECPGGTKCAANKEGDVCPAGKYGKPREHTAHCISCPAAQYQASTRAVRCQTCPRGYSTRGATGQAACPLCPSKGWIGGGGNQRLKGYKAFHLQTIYPPYNENPVKKLDGYHSCPWGGDGHWGCHSNGGRKTFTTFITSKVSAYYEFFFKKVDDWVHYKFSYMPSGARITSESLTKGQGLYQAIWISAGQRVKLDYTCDNYGSLNAGGSGYNCEVQFVRKYWKGHVNNLVFYQTDPGSGYC